MYLFVEVQNIFDWQIFNLNKYGLNPNGPELLEPRKLRGEGQMAPPSEFTNYNPNAKTDVAIYSQL